MGERAKKKRAEESRARKAKKATEQAQLEEEVPVSQSNAGNSKKIRAAPSSHVPSSSAATRHSTRLLQVSSLKLESSGKRTSADIHNDESVVTRPQRSATAAANALLQQLQIGESERVDSEDDPDGKYNSEIDAKMMVLILKIQMAI
jgi:hypothetical protein